MVGSAFGCLSPHRHTQMELLISVLAGLLVEKELFRTYFLSATTFFFFSFLHSALDKLCLCVTCPQYKISLVTAAAANLEKNRKKDSQSASSGILPGFTFPFSAIAKSTKWQILFCVQHLRWRSNAKKKSLLNDTTALILFPGASGTMFEQPILVCDQYESNMSRLRNTRDTLLTLPLPLYYGDGLKCFWEDESQLLESFAVTDCNVYQDDDPAKASITTEAESCK